MVLSTGEVQDAVIVICRKLFLCAFIHLQRAKNENDERGTGREMKRGTRGIDGSKLRKEDQTERGKYNYRNNNKDVKQSQSPARYILLEGESCCHEKTVGLARSSERFKKEENEGNKHILSSIVECDDENISRMVRTWSVNERRYG
jgi:hypothetical protein